MNLRDVRAIKGVIDKSIKYFELYGAKHDACFKKLRNYPYLSNYLTEPDREILNLHLKIKDNLGEALHFCELAEADAKQGDVHPGMLEQAFPLINSFFEIADKDRPYLIKLHLEFEKNNFDKEVIEIVGGRILDFTKFNSNGKIHDLYQVYHKIVDRVKAGINEKKDISFGSPKIQEKLELSQKKGNMGKFRVYLRIFFDKYLTDGNIMDIVNTLFASLPYSLDKLNIVTKSLEYNLFKIRAENKIRILQNKDANYIKKVLLDYLRNCIVHLLENNDSLILTPSLEYELKIINSEQHFAFNDSRSALDHYLIRMDFSTLFLVYLVTENCFESLPSAVLSNLQIINSYKGKTNVEKSRIINHLQAKHNEIVQTTNFYRSFSIYNILAHETQHGLDSFYLSTQNKLLFLLRYLISKSNYYKNHRVLNLGSELLTLVELYYAIRSEATTQFREFIVQYKAKSEKDKSYCLVNPLPTFNQNSIVQSINDLITQLFKESLDNDVKNLKQEYAFYNISYPISQIINIVIFLADCKTRGIEPIFIDANSLVKLTNLFPRACNSLIGYSNLYPIPEGTPDWFLVNALRKGADSYVLDVFRRNKIRTYKIDDVSKLIQNSVPFYIFRPPYDTMNQTLNKIINTNEVTYFDLYEKSCNLLGITDRIISVRMFAELAEKIYEAREVLMDESRGINAA